MADVELLEANGNEVVEQSYMGLYDPRCNRKPENRDCPNFKTFLEEKYDRKSWFKVRGFIYICTVIYTVWISNR